MRLAISVGGRKLCLRTKSPPNHRLTTHHILGALQPQARPRRRLRHRPAAHRANARCLPRAQRSRSSADAATIADKYSAPCAAAVPLISSIWSSVSAKDAVNGGGGPCAVTTPTPRRSAWCWPALGRCGRSHRQHATRSPAVRRPVRVMA